MTAYARPKFAGSFFKSPRGTATLEKEKADRDESALEILVKKDVKARDGRCRFPQKHKCRGGMEVIHIKDRSTGGEFVSSNLWWGCKWIHRSGPKSIHSKDIIVEPLTDKGANGPLAFYLRVYAEGRRDQFADQLIARESAPGRVEK